MNIFENAKFGDPYKTIYGSEVFFLHRLDDGSVSCLVGNEKNYGFSILEEDEIESRWEEPINEEELDRLAVIEGAKAIAHFVNREQSKFAYEWADLVKDSYIAGYRKAKENYVNNVIIK